jgi:hypothetical protein
MPSRSLLRAFMLLWWTVGLVLLVASVRTVQDSLTPTHHSPVVLLAAVEAVSALLFLFPRTMRVGAAGLLLTLAVALVVHVAMRQLRWDLLLFAAAVYFIAVHGPLSRPQWREATSRG